MLPVNHYTDIKNAPVFIRTLERLTANLQKNTNIDKSMIKLFKEGLRKLQLKDIFVFKIISVRFTS